MGASKKEAGVDIQALPHSRAVMKKQQPTRSSVIVLKQLLNHIPRGMFNRLAVETGVDRKARSFGVTSHLTAMIFA